jgi:hypothetical protein
MGGLKAALTVPALLCLGMIPCSAGAEPCAYQSFWVSTEHEICATDSCGRILSSLPLTMLGGDAQGVAVDTDTTLWVVSDQPAEIVHVDRAGSHIGGFPLTGGGPATDLALSLGSVWVSTADGSVHRYSRLGVHNATFGATGCAFPVGISLDTGQSAIWVVGETGDLCKYSQDGVLIEQLNVGASCPRPTGLEFDGVQDVLWVGDGDQNAVCLIDPEGEQLQSVSVGCFGMTGVSFPKEFPTSSAPGRPLLVTAPRIVGVSPNPCHPRTVIELSNPAEGRIRVRVYDSLGRRVASLADRIFPAGHHAVSWDGRTDGGRKAGDGVYLVKLESRDAGATAKLTLVR